MPKIERMSVTGNPPHCSVRTGTRPAPPPISQKASAMPSAQIAASQGCQKRRTPDTTSNAHSTTITIAGRHCWSYG